MEKNKTYDKRSSSEPSGAKRRLVRICFTFITILMLCATMVVPAFAYGVTYEKDNQLMPLITGSLQLKLYANTVTPSAQSALHDVEIVLPTQYDYLNDASNYYDMAEYIEYYNRTVGSDENRWQDYSLDIRGGRWKYDVSNNQFWRFRTYIDCWSLLNPEDNAYFDRATFYLDSFAMPMTENILKNLFAVRFENRADYRVKASVHYVDDDGKLSVAPYSQTIAGLQGGIWSQAFFDARGIQTFAVWCNQYGIEEGEPVLFTDVVVEVDARKYGYGSLHDISFQNLTHVFFNANYQRPAYWQPHEGANWFVRQVKDELNWAENAPEPPEVIEGDPFVGWFASILAGFFDVELFPGFSFGGIFTILITLTVVFLVLKYFAGG